MRNSGSLVTMMALSRRVAAMVEQEIFGQGEKRDKSDIFCSKECAGDPFYFPKKISRNRLLSCLNSSAVGGSMKIVLSTTLSASRIGG